MMHKPQSTFGIFNADVLALKDPHYKRLNFCSITRGSSWNDVWRCDDPAHQH